MSYCSISLCSLTQCWERTEIYHQCVCLCTVTLHSYLCTPNFSSKEKIRKALSIKMKTAWNYEWFSLDTNLLMLEPKNRTRGGLTKTTDQSERTEKWRTYEMSSTEINEQHHFQIWFYVYSWYEAPKVNHLFSPSKFSTCIYRSGR
jgi:hypothetical protein